MPSVSRATALRPDTHQARQTRSSVKTLKYALAPGESAVSSPIQCNPGWIAQRVEISPSASFSMPYATTAILCTVPCRISPFLNLVQTLEMGPVALLSIIPFCLHCLGMGLSHCTDRFQNTSALRACPVDQSLGSGCVRVASYWVQRDRLLV